MRKAFTLVELLVVVVVIAILASITFKITGLGESSRARADTISRMQRLENCISGYYAAYGSYPPVALQGRSRNIYYKANANGIQQVTEDPDTGVDLKTDKGWMQVEAACRSQPVAAEFPFTGVWAAYAKRVSDELVRLGQSDMVFDGLPNPGRLSGKKDLPDWTDTQVFRFGLMSYLLPRYVVMMGYGGQSDQAGAKNLYEFAQWGDNNKMPARFEDGLPYDSWGDLNQDLTDTSKGNRWKVAALPSQAITARWMPNLEGILWRRSPQSMVLYGVDTRDGRWGGFGVTSPPSKSDIYSSGDSQSGEGGGASQPYLLDQITCKDGWQRDFYYYSPQPYQSYRLWSAGPNGKTFPPWYPDEEIDTLEAREEVRNWIADDIVHLSN